MIKELLFPWQVNSDISIQLSYAFLKDSVGI